jgi:hypothetical protein
MAPHDPRPAYDNPIVYGDIEIYARLGKIAEQEEGAAKALVKKFEIPIRSGKAWIVKKGT